MYIFCILYTLKSALLYMFMTVHQNGVLICSSGMSSFPVKILYTCYLQLSSSPGLLHLCACFNCVGSGNLGGMDQVRVDMR